MQRHVIPVRENWQAKVEALGFNYHTLNSVTYWDESVYYEFDYRQIDVLEKSTRELHRLCLEAVDHVIKKDLLDLFYIPAEFKDQITASWNQETPSIYGRFDLSWN